MFLRIFECSKAVKLKCGVLEQNYLLLLCLSSRIVLYFNESTLVSIDGLVWSVMEYLLYLKSLKVLIT